MKIQYLLFILVLFTSCHSIYFQAGPTYDTGSIGREFSLDKTESDWGGSMEVGVGITETDLLSLHWDYIGYSTSDGNHPKIIALEYSKVKAKNHFSFVFGGGVGYSYDFPSSLTIPLRVGAFYKIPIKDQVGFRIGILERPQYSFGRGGQFTNGVSLMAGFEF